MKIFNKKWITKYVVGPFGFGHLVACSSNFWTEQFGKVGIFSLCGLVLLLFMLVFLIGVIRVGLLVYRPIFQSDIIKVKYTENGLTMIANVRRLREENE